LRPRWPTLYAARKRRLDPNIGLPPLTDSFFGWIPRLYKVSEQQILASAGLDAFVVRIANGSRVEFIGQPRLTCGDNSF
jgi:hypothetical protein